MQRRALLVAAMAGVLVIAALTAAGCAHREESPPPREAPREFVAAPHSPEPRSEVQAGYATWYGARLAGHRTASGEVFDPRQMTAAHRSLPFGTWVEVRCVDTGLRVRVRITDRGPFGHEERIIDLSRAAADLLGIRHRGVAAVELRVVAGPSAGP
jgi:rare lipoprotein A